MDTVWLQVVNYLDAYFEQLVMAVVRHNEGISQEHRIKYEKLQRISIVCSRGDKCAFRVNAVLLADGPGLRVTTGCNGGGWVRM